MVSGVHKCAMVQEMSNQQSEKQCFSNRTQTWIALEKLVATYNFATSLFCTAQSPLKTSLDDDIWYLAVRKLYIIPRQLLCRDLGSFASNDKHSLEEQFWYLAFATSTVASSRVATLGWQNYHCMVSGFT